MVSSKVNQAENEVSPPLNDIKAKDDVMLVSNEANQSDQLCND